MPTTPSFKTNQLFNNMTREERLVFCKSCTNKKLDMQIGLICSLTGKMADFEESCTDYAENEKIVIQETANKKDKELAEPGREKTFNVFVALIGISIGVIIYSHLPFHRVNETKLLKDIIRLGLEAGLFYAIFNGKKWAKVLMTILCILAILIGFFPMMEIVDKSSEGILLLIILSAYGFAAYFLNYDKDFKAFFEYQRKTAQGY